MTKKVTKSGVKIISNIQGAIPKPSDVSILELNNPPRVVIDIEGAKVLPKFHDVFGPQVALMYTNKKLIFTLKMFTMSQCCL